jgi:hypothetical protein
MNKWGLGTNQFKIQNSKFKIKYWGLGTGDWGLGRIIITYCLLTHNSELAKRRATANTTHYSLLSTQHSLMLLQLLLVGKINVLGDKFLNRD